MTPRRARCSPVWLVAVLAGACGSLFPKSPPSDFYLLTAAEPPARVSPPAPAPPILLGAVRLPPYLDRRELVTRLAPNQLRVEDLELWAEPLRESVPRTIERDLATQLGERTRAGQDCTVDGRGAARARHRRRDPSLREDVAPDRRARGGLDDRGARRRRGAHAPGHDPVARDAGAGHAGGRDGDERRAHGAEPRHRRGRAAARPLGRGPGSGTPDACHVAGALAR